MKSKIFLFTFIYFLSSCNYSVIMNATHGQATDSVDAETRTDADISPQLEIPEVSK